MTFVNEYIPETDYGKYDLPRVCGNQNLQMRRGKMHSRHWTIDRELEAFLIKVWAQHESRFEGWAFYWKGEWIFFEMSGVDTGGLLLPDGFCDYSYQIRKFTMPEQLKQQQAQVVSDLRQALGDYGGGGVFSDCKQGSANIEFIEE